MHSHNILFLPHHTICMGMVCSLISVPQIICSLSKGTVLPFYLEGKDYMSPMVPNSAWPRKDAQGR